MRLILLEGNDEFDESEMPVVLEPPAEESEDPLSGITLQSLVGFTSPKTMKMGGTIDGKDVVILVDSGASSNFISTSVAQQLGLPLSTYAPFGVTLGTGMKVFGDGICKNVKIKVQGLKICDDFFPLELGSLDIFWEYYGWKY